MREKLEINDNNEQADSKWNLPEPVRDVLDKESDLD